MSRALRWSKARAYSCILSSFHSLTCSLHRNVAIPRVGSVTADDLIGQPYGLTYEIQQKNLKTLPPKTLQEVGACLRIILSILPLADFVNTEDTDATNELINDGEFVQPLTFNEIQALRQSGVHASVRLRYSLFVRSNLRIQCRKSSKSRLSNIPTTNSRLNTVKKNTRNARRRSKPTA